ncbi:FGGY-family carbohydrate kinase [Zhengella sp. ZM62]|uniref:FGGY-family carbohydrate kinase n=1 Tax=Zhengella sedimenti TaxID=3390035 RepID=UPI003974F23F
MAREPLFVGIDAGTSGVRAIAIDAKQQVVAQGAARMDAFGTDHRSPRIWQAALKASLESLFATVDPSLVKSLSVDGTSGTMLPVDAGGQPVGQPMMYNDPVEDGTIVDAVGRAAPESSAARGVNSALARAIVLQGAPGTVRVIHQADWLAGLLSGRFDLSDENNALKTGYDPVSRQWPDWIARTGMATERLPAVLEPGKVMARAGGRLARQFGLAPQALVIAGTTDGCASFLATGASRPGDGVTALGTTLTIKLFSDKPVFAPQFGIYSHRLAGGWLAGGASNTGGNVLAAHFASDEIAALSRRIDPETDTGFDYYPLSRTGERFPVNDPAMVPRIEPRPADDALFLKAILEGIANVEAMAYAKLFEFGAPALASIRTVGGGASNPVWSAMRQRKLAVPALPVLSLEAAFGTALLAMQGAGQGQA